MGSALDKLRKGSSKVESVIDNRVEEVLPKGVYQEDRRFQDVQYQDDRVSSNRRYEEERRFEETGRYQEPRRYQEETVRGRDDRYYGSPVEYQATDRGTAQFSKVTQPMRAEVIEDYHRADPRFDNRRSGSIPVDQVPVPTELYKSNPDWFGLQVLGLSSSANVRLIKSRALDIAPLELSNIVDSTGKVSEKLHNFMMQYGITVLPLRECGVFETITAINGFEIVEYKGKKFASYCGEDYPTSYIRKLENDIIDKISCAMIFGLEEIEGDFNTYRWNKNESRLSKMVSINGREVEVPSLCISEMEYILAHLRLHKVNILDVKGDFPHIIVGLDLGGVELKDGEERY